MREERLPIATFLDIETNKLWKWDGHNWISKSLTVDKALDVAQSAVDREMVAEAEDGK